MARQEKPDMARLKNALEYNPVSGDFSWKDTSRIKKRSRTRKCGSLRKTGHIMIGFERSNFCAGVMAWYIVTGEWPNGVIDYKDGNPSNTAFENLTHISRSEWQWKKPKEIANSSGVKGLYIEDRPGSKYTAQIYKNGKRYRKRFETRDEAIAYLKKTRAALHGIYATDE